VFDAVGSLLVDASGAVPGAPGLWAVGDVAARPHPVLGRVPGGHWSAALHDPDTTARALLGVQGGSAHAPYVFSRQLGHDLALFGVPTGDPTTLRGTPGEGSWVAFWTVADPAAPGDPRAAVVRAVLLVDSPRDVGAVRKAFTRPEPLAVDLDRVSDPSVRLRDALAPR
jgi:3-phenylpropionate/trans-cinnamate dioxygenase ferredoxin reductase subunit